MISYLSANGDYGLYSPLLPVSIVLISFKIVEIFMNEKNRVFSFFETLVLGKNFMKNNESDTIFWVRFLLGFLST